MDYNIGDIVKFRNDAGMFQVKIMRKIDTNDATRGFDDCLSFNGKMRLEVHSGQCYEYIITMTSREESKIIVCALDTACNEVNYYLGKIVQYEEKEDVFELMK